MQLVRGFYDVEAGGWRWTKGRFAVTLKPPAGAAEKGALLELKLNVPEPVLQRVHAIQLTASINGVAMDPETFSKPGNYVYSRNVPPASLAGEAVTIDFALDKFLAAGVVEQRELGVIVTSAGLLRQ
jgi:hypothetical protein